MPRQDSQQPLTSGEPVGNLSALEGKDVPDSLSSSGALEVRPGITRSLEAFRRDLRELLKDHAGEWVAYHHDERVGFGKSKTDLYRRCLDRGFNRGEFVVEFVEAQDSHVALPTMLEDRS